LSTVLGRGGEEAGSKRSLFRDNRNAKFGAMIS